MMNRITARHRTIEAGDSLTFNYGVHKIPVNVVSVTVDKVTVKHVLAGRTTFDVDAHDLYPYPKQ
jgi:FKBP-type peptidyl-prolyl cis-trans isomerase 2